MRLTWFLPQLSLLCLGFQVASMLPNSVGTPLSLSYLFATSDSVPYIFLFSLKLLHALLRPQHPLLFSIPSHCSLILPYGIFFYHTLNANVFKHIKRCSIPLTLERKQMKTMRDHFSPVGLAKHEEFGNSLWAMM